MPNQQGVGEISTPSSFEDAKETNARAGTHMAIAMCMQSRVRCINNGHVIYSDKFHFRLNRKRTLFDCTKYQKMMEALKASISSITFFKSDTRLWSFYLARE